MAYKQYEIQSKSKNTFALVSAFDEGRLSSYFESQAKTYGNLLNCSFNNYEQLDFKLGFTEREFESAVPERNEKSFIQEYFYPIVMRGLNRTNKSLDYKEKYFFTIDKTLCNIKLDNDNYYGVLRLGDKPVLYFLYCSPQDMISYLKK